MYFDEVPEELRGWNREKRIEWYERNVRKYLPAYELIERITSEMNTDQLKHEISKIKIEIALLESQIFTLESVSLKDLVVALDEAIRTLKQARLEKTKVLIQNLRQTDSNTLLTVNAKFQAAIDVVAAIEEQITSLCETERVDVRPYLKLGTVISGVRI